MRMRMYHSEHTPAKELQKNQVNYDNKIHKWTNANTDELSNKKTYTQLRTYMKARDWS